MFLVTAILSSNLIAPVATVRTVTPDLLKEAGIEVAQGKARVNGVSFPMTTFSGGGSVAELALKARRAFAGKFTVTFDQGVLAVADIRSSQCPTCALPTLKNLEEIQAKTYVFTASELPGGGLVAFGSEAGPLVQATKGDGKSLSYEGQAFAKDAIDGLALESSSAYEFGRGRTNTVVANGAGAPGVLHGLLASQLEARGYQRAPHDGKEALGNTVQTLWTKDDLTVSISVTAGDSGQTSRVMIHEVSIR